MYFFVYQMEITCSGIDNSSNYIRLLHIFLTKFPHLSRIESASLLPPHNDFFFLTGFLKSQLSKELHYVLSLLLNKYMLVIFK